MGFKHIVNIVRDIWISRRNLFCITRIGPDLDRPWMSYLPVVECGYTMYISYMDFKIRYISGTSYR